ncbi:MAG: hypothetical protein Q9186_004827 [Xanthomendoza sp. 1 TL-2023]
MHFTYVVASAIVAALATASPRFPAGHAFPGHSLNPSASAVTTTSVSTPQDGDIGPIGPYNPFPAGLSLPDRLTIPTTTAVTATSARMSNAGHIGPVGPHDILPTGTLFPSYRLPSYIDYPPAHGVTITEEEIRQCLRDLLACRRDKGALLDHLLCLHERKEDCHRPQHPHPSHHTTHQPSETGTIVPGAIESHEDPFHLTTTMAPVETGHTSYTDHATEYIGGHPYVGPISSDVWQDYLCRHRQSGCHRTVTPSPESTKTHLVYEHGHPGSHDYPHLTLMTVSRQQERAARITPTA